MDLLAQITEIQPTQSGIIPVGTIYASFKNIGTEATNVNGTPLEPGEAKDYPFIGKGYSDIPYEIVPNSKLKILYII